MLLCPRDARQGHLTTHIERQHFIADALPRPQFQPATARVDTCDRLTKDRAAGLFYPGMDIQAVLLRHLDHGVDADALGVTLAALRLDQADREALRSGVDLHLVHRQPLPGAVQGDGAHGVDAGLLAEIDLDAVDLPDQVDGLL